MLFPASRIRILASQSVLMTRARKPTEPAVRLPPKHFQSLSRSTFRNERRGIRTDFLWARRGAGVGGWVWLGGNFRSKAGTH